MVMKKQNENREELLPTRCAAAESTETRSGFSFADNRRSTNVQRKLIEGVRACEPIPQRFGDDSSVSNPMMQRELGGYDDSAHQKPDLLKTTAESTADIVQRSVGLEIESSASWQVYNQGYEAVTGEHLVLYATPQFRLETELSGKLEFVIEPPLDTPQELVSVMDDVVQVARAIDTAKIVTRQNVRDDFASDHFKRETRKDVDLFKLSDVVKGGAPYYISKGLGEFQGGFQATVGVHLSAVPFLLERISKGDLIENYPSSNQMDRARSTAEKTRKEATGKPFTDYSGISPAMEGLLNLIYYYIFVGTPTDRKPFPKGITQVMARTNFGKMFSMTPEASMLARYPEQWLNLVTRVADIDPSRKVFCGTFGDTAEEVSSVDITIADWLLNMTRNVDVLSVSGGGPEVLKTMGDMDKTDDLGAEGENNQAVILELRGLDFNSKPIKDWVPFAYNIAKIIERLNSRNNDGMQAMKDVSDKDGGAMYWSPWRAEQEGGENILSMGIEAMKAPFNAQVVGLIIRARERAKLARWEKDF